MDEDLSLPLSQPIYQVDDPRDKFISHSLLTKKSIDGHQGDSTLTINCTLLEFITVVKIFVFVGFVFRNPLGNIPGQYDHVSVMIVPYSRYVYRLAEGTYHCPRVRTWAASKSDMQQASS